TTVRTPHCHRSCRRPPIPALVLATRRNGSAYLAPPPSPDSCGPPWLALPRSRNCDCPPDSCRNNRVGPGCRPWWHSWNRGRWSIPDPVDAPALLPGFALPVPADTGGWCDGPGPPPPVVPVESGSLSRHWLPRNCHPPTDACPAPALPRNTVARYAQTTARTTSTLEIARAGSSRTWNDAEPPDQSSAR